MHVVSLEIEKIKRINVAKIQPRSNVVVIGGKNGQGKSSILDAIVMAIGGKSKIPEMPVQEGSKKAHISLDIGKFKIARWWTSPTQSYLRVQNAEGIEIKSGQSELDKIVNDLTFDPLEFATMEPKKRLDIIRKLTGLDFTALDAEYKKLYDERTIVNRDVERFGTELKAMPSFELGKEPTRPDEVYKKMDEANKVNSSIEALKKELAQTEQRLADLDKEYARVREHKINVKNQLEKLTPVRTDKFQKEIEEYHDWNKKNDAMKIRASAEKRFLEVQQKSEQLTRRLGEIKEEKELRLTSATMPVEGMKMGEGDIVFGGIPFSQVNTAEQIRISFAVQIFLNPQLKVAFIRAGSLLDNDSMALVQKIATDTGTQVWIETVKNEKEEGIVFVEDGNVTDLGQEEDKNQTNFGF